MRATTAATRPDRVTASDVFTRVRQLVPAIAARADETEHARRVPGDLLDELARAGCFRMLLPATHGGVEGDLSTAMRIVQEISRADASAGWIVALGSSAWRDLAGLPRATFDALYAGGPDTLVIGVFNPSGSLCDAAEGYRVRGRWSFASGCEHATWIYGNCLHEGAPPPGLRTAVFPAGDVVIEDTWHSLGLRGTGSHHFHVDDVIVPRDRTCATLEAEPCVDTVLVRIPPPSHFALMLASVAVGVGWGAVDDVTSLATGKVPLLAHAPLATDALFQSELARGDAALRAARASLREEAEAAWDDARQGLPVTDERRARVRSTAAWATEQAATVVTSLHRLAGSAGVFDGHPLPRRLRDVQTITQHFLVKPGTFRTAGGALAGQPIDVPVF